MDINTGTTRWAPRQSGGVKPLEQCNKTSTGTVSKPIPWDTAVQRTGRSEKPKGLNILKETEQSVRYVCPP